MELRVLQYFLAVTREQSISGAGETDGVRFLTKTAKALQEDFPDIHFHIISGDGISVLENLDRGLIDFGLVFGEVDTSKYNMLKVPYKDTWGVLMRHDADLAEKEVITSEDLQDKPLILSRQQSSRSSLIKRLGKKYEDLNIVGTYNLLFNGSLMVKDGMGYALCFDKIIHITEHSGLCFRPLMPELSEEMHIIWKKYQIFPKAAEKFLQKMRQFSE